MRRSRTRWGLCAAAVLVLATSNPFALAPDSPWVSGDVGQVRLSGSADVSGTPGDTNRVWTVRGAGGDIWGSEDAFQFVSAPIDTASAAVGARVTHVDDTHSFAKAGVMMRETLNPSSRHVILDVRPNGAVEFMMRDTFGGATTFIAGATVQFPVWLSLSRSENTFTAYVSQNATSWTQIGAKTVPLPMAIRAGLVVNSHDPAQLNTSTFDDVFVSTTAAERLPEPWGMMRVGDSKGDGATYSNGTFSVRGGGSDIWGTADGLLLVYQSLYGDGEIQARVTSVENTHPFAKAGLMMREGFGDAGAAAVIIDVRPDGSIEFMARSTRGQPMSFIGGAFQPTPVWLKLARRGSQFTGSISADGVSWTVVGTVQATLPPDGQPDFSYRAGLAVTSHDPSKVNTSTFDHVSVVGAPVNLVVNPGFEESASPAVGPGWVADSNRQTPATTETAARHGGRVSGACVTTSTRDCGIYQDITLPETGVYLVGAWVAADHAGGLFGLEAERGPQSWQVANGGLGQYQFYWTTISGRAGEVIRVWMYAPASAGRVYIDDVAVRRSDPYT